MQEDSIQLQWIPECFEPSKTIQVETEIDISLIFENNESVLNQTAIVYGKIFRSIKDIFKHDFVFFKPKIIWNDNCKKLILKVSMIEKDKWEHIEQAIIWNQEGYERVCEILADTIAKLSLFKD